MIMMMFQKIFKELRAIREELLGRNLYDVGAIDKQDYSEALREEALALQKEEKKNGGDINSNL